jgi:uncharacterized membrane protein YgcG
MMATDPRLMRASDQDRDRTAQMLREHHAMGRLDADEFSERLDKVFLAKTIGDLDELTADLPAVDPYPLPTSSLSRHNPGSALPAASVLDAMSRGRGRLSPAWQAAWGSWFCTSLVLTVIWLLTGAGYPWPLWVIGIWGAILGGRWIIGAHPQGHKRDRIRGGRFDQGQIGQGGDGTGSPPGGS